MQIITGAVDSRLNYNTIQYTIFNHPITDCSRLISRRHTLYCRIMFLAEVGKFLLDNLFNFFGRQRFLRMVAALDRWVLRFYHFCSHK